MDIVKLKERLKSIIENYDIVEHNFNYTYHFYSAKIFENNFTEEELIYITNNLLDEYKNIKIPCEIKDNVLITDIGTFLLVDIGPENILEDEIWIKSNNIDVKKINESKEIILDEFRKIIMRLNYYTNVSKDNVMYVTHTTNKNVKLLQEIFNIYQYHKFLKNVDYNILNRRFKTSQYSFLPILPLETLNNPNRIVEINENNIERLEYLYENVSKFENNPIIDFYFSIKENRAQKKDINKFKKTLLRPCSIYYFNLAYLYLKNNFNEYLDDNYLIELYKINYDKIIKINDKKVIDLAKKLENKSPLVKITNDASKVHLSYSHDYYFYKDRPFVYVKKECGLKMLDTNNVNFEDYFIYLNELFVKLYKMYYKPYLKTINDDSKDNLYDFMSAIIFNPNNFCSIARNYNFSVDEIKKLISIVKCYGKEAEEKFNEFYKKFCDDERKRVLSFYNYLVANKNDGEKVLEGIKKFGISPDEVYTEILNNKFVDSKVKNVILSIVELYLSDRLKVIDVLYIVDEMLDRNISLDEILKEKEIDKKVYDRILTTLYKKNPIIYKYINNSVKKGTRKKNQKLIKLGYTILKHDIKSLEEYNMFYPTYEFNELLDYLKDTELFDKLLLKASLWSDYEQDFDKEEIKHK